MPQTFRPCPICMKDDSVFYFENPMAAVGGFNMSYTVVRCKHCGFFFARQLPDLNTFSAYYQSVSKYDSPGTLSDVDQARIDFAVHFLNGRVEKSASIADLGCGTGALLGGLKKHGWLHLQGLDPAPHASHLAQEIYGILDIKRGTMLDAHELLNLQEVDLICIMAVLEHLPNLKQDLEQLFAKLPLKCKVLIEVPAIEFFPNPNGEPFGEFSLEHIQFFDVTSLNNLMHSLGAEPIAVELMSLPMVESGAIFGLYEWTGCAPLNPTFSISHSEKMEVYKVQSQQKLDIALQHIPEGPLILYGAGSHTARLLSHLNNMPESTVLSIVDSNPNLTGKKIDRWIVQPTNSIHYTPNIPVLISSFRSQNSIASILKKSAANPIVLMYK